MKRPFMVSTLQVLNYALAEIRITGLRYLGDGKTLGIEIKDPTRSLEQNALIHPIIRLWAKHVQHPVNGIMTQMSEEEWKRILVASFRGETQRMTVDLAGHVFFLDSIHTAEFTKPECSEFIEFLYAGLAQRGVEVGREMEPSGKVAA